MREIPKKNYIILFFIVIATICLTLVVADIYNSKDQKVSKFYENSNKISIKDFSEYIIENPNSIIYISDKYDLKNKSFEKKLEKKLENLNLKENFAFIEKNEINSEFIKFLNDNYNLTIDIDKTPILIVIIDNKIVNNMVITGDMDVNTLIDYEVFE